MNNENLHQGSMGYFTRNTVSALVLLLTMTSVTTTTARSSFENYLKIPALGRTFRLGNLYDARTAHFFNENIFKTLVFPNSTLISTKKQRVTLQSKVVQNYKDKFQLLDIDPNTALNILSGLVDPEDSSIVLTSMGNDDEDQVTGLLVIKHKTFIEYLDIYTNSLRRLYKETSYKGQGQRAATHVVTGITWGANVAITLAGTACKYKTRRQILTEIEAELDALMETPANHSLESKTNFSILIKSDILLPLHKPTTHSQVHQLVSQLPDLLQQHYDGKGVPILYHLTPLQSIQSYLKLEAEANILPIQKVADYTLRKFYRIFDENLLAERLLNSLKAKLSSNNKCVKQETQQNFNKLQKDFYEFQDNFKSDLRDALVEARSSFGSRPNTTELTNLENRFQNSEYCEARFGTILEQFDDALKKIERCNIIRDNYQGIDYFTSETKFYSKMLQNINRTVYILFLKDNQDLEAVDAEKNSQDQLSTFLNDLYFETKNNTLLIVDCDFRLLMCSSVKKTVIRKIVEGNLRSSDFVGSSRDDGNTVDSKISIDEDLSRELEFCQHSMNQSIHKLQNDLELLKEKIEGLNDTREVINSDQINNLHPFKDVLKLVNDTFKTQSYEMDPVGDGITDLNLTDDKTSNTSLSELDGDKMNRNVTLDFVFQNGNHSIEVHANENKNELNRVNGTSQYLSYEGDAITNMNLTETRNTTFPDVLGNQIDENVTQVSLFQNEDYEEHSLDLYSNKDELNVVNATFENLSYEGELIGDAIPYENFTDTSNSTLSELLGNKMNENFTLGLDFQNEQHSMAQKFNLTAENKQNDTETYGENTDYELAIDTSNEYTRNGGNESAEYFRDDSLPQ